MRREFQQLEGEEMLIPCMYGCEQNSKRLALAAPAKPTNSPLLQRQVLLRARILKKQNKQTNKQQKPTLTP